MNLTIQILIKNNIKTINKCLESLRPFIKNILILDIGSTDGTLSICEEFGCRIERVYLENNYSNVRNAHVNAGWNLMIQPWEFLVQGADRIKEIALSKEKFSCHVKIVQGTIFTKEIRLWSNELQFKNPIFETLDDDSQEESIIIYSEQKEIDLAERYRIIENWKLKDPISVEPYYYQALTLLLESRFTEFEKIAQYYLFKEKNKQGIASTMLRYYLAIIQFQSGRGNDAVKNALICIGNNPLMAEFWCLLGDIHCERQLYHKAFHFYENAILLGQKRLKSEKWPLDISKYKEHPSHMIAQIKDVLKEENPYVYERKS